jgi:hypothetical protein
MLEKDSEQVQRYCRNCGNVLRSGARFCVSCGEQLVKGTDNFLGDPKRTDTTRYLCAAAYQNKTFRNYVIEQIIDQKHKAIGPAYGVDLATVARHCLIAKRFEIGRDIIFMALFLVAIILGGIFGPGLILLPLLVVWFILFVQASAFDLEIASTFSKRTFNPDSSHFLFNNSLSSTLEGRLANVTSQQNGNVVVYSGSRFSPFTGSGIDAGGWSFTLRVDKGKEILGSSLEPIPFKLEELYDHVADRIMEFGIDGLAIEDKLYVDGQEIRDDKRFLYDPFTRPSNKVDPSLIKSFIDSSTQAVRYYKCVHVNSWKGELISSIFIRFIRVKNRLYVEADYFLLLPVREEYHRVDTLSPVLSLRQVWNSAITSAFRAPFLLAFSPLFVLRHISRPIERWLQQRQIKNLIKANLAFDYGANISVREIATSYDYRRYFQKLDKEMHFKIIERQILDGLTEFLDSKNIDTSDLEDRRQTILNEGVIVTGGSIQAESLAVGKGALAAGLARIIGAARLQGSELKEHNRGGGNVGQRSSK